MNGPLDRVIYISVPDGFHHHVEGLTIDPSILLPVETSGDPASWDPDELSWEMIIAGMLKVLAYEPNHEDSDYYRRFVRAVRPQIVEELSETGILQARNGEYAVAEEIFLALAGLEPGLIHPRVNLALVNEQRADAFERVGNDDHAAVCRDRATEIYDDLLLHADVPGEVHLNAGLFFLKEQRYDRARRLLESFTEESDDEGKVSRARSLLREIDSQRLSDGLYQEAFSLIRASQEREGIKKIRGFLDENPDSWRGWFLLGWGHRRLGHFTEGQDAFERSLELGGDTADTLNELAICAMELGAFDESKRHLEAALQRDPDDTRVMSNLGVLALKQGDTEGARRFFEAVRELAPDDPIAQQFFKNE